MDNENTLFYVDYYKARAKAQEMGLVECSYGDIDDDTSYVCYNKSGDRQDATAIECYYTWENTDKGFCPIHDPDESFAESIERCYGIVVER